MILKKKLKRTSSTVRVISGNKPIAISSTNPIVIIDEPQSVDNTPKAKDAIKS